MIRFRSDFEIILKGKPMSLNDRLKEIRARLESWEAELPRLVQPERSHIQNIADISLLLSVVEIYREALEYYSKHESVIKEAYHSNDDRQITVVHTFINHKANEVLASAEQLVDRGEK